MDHRLVTMEKASNKIAIMRLKIKALNYLGEKSDGYRYKHFVFF